MATLYERINDNIGHAVFKTATQVTAKSSNEYGPDTVEGTADDTWNAAVYSAGVDGFLDPPDTPGYPDPDTGVADTSLYFEGAPGLDPQSKADDILVMPRTPIIKDYYTSTYKEDPEFNESNYKNILTRYCRQAIRDITDKQLAANPKDMHLFCQNLFIMNMGTFGDQTNTLAFGEFAVPWKDADGGFFIDNNYVLWVARQFEGLQVPAHEISPEKGLRVTDADSIYYSGTDYRNPVFYRSSSKLYIYPAITETETGRCSMVKFDDRFTVDLEEIAYFPNHLTFLVVLYASIRALKLSAGDMRDDFASNYSSPLLVWRTLYGTGPADDTVSIPTLPTFVTGTTSFDTEGLEYGGKQPGMTKNSGEPLDGDPPYTEEAEGLETIQTVMSSLWDRIHDEEEPALVQSEIARFDVLSTDYNRKLTTATSKFGMELQLYQAELNDWKTKFDTVMNVWNQYQQSYQTRMQMLEQEIQRYEMEYKSHFFPKHYQEKQKEEGSI